MNRTHQAEKKLFVLRDRGGVLDKNWYIEFKEGGKRIKKYFTINHGKTIAERRKLAQKYLRKLRKEAKQVPANIDEKEKLYAALENDRPFLERKTYQTYKSKLDQLFDWLAGDEVTTERLRLYFHLYRQTHAQTGTYDCRRQLMTYFKKVGLDHLLAPIRIKKGTHQPLRYFQPHQCKMLLGYLKYEDPQLYLHCLFIYYLAIRPRKELVHVRVDDIFHSERKLAVRGEFAKTDESLFVHIPPKFYPYLEPLKDLPPTSYIFPAFRDKYRPAGRNTYGRRFREVLDQFGFDKNYQLYSWKHTGCVAVYKATKNILALRDHCRHRDVSTTQKYLRQLGLDDYEDFYEQFPSPTEWR